MMQTDLGFQNSPQLVSSKGRSLVLLPAIGTILVIVVMLSVRIAPWKSLRINTMEAEVEISNTSHYSADVEDLISKGCPEPYTDPLFCMNPEIPVLGGIDFVEYFEDFKLADSSGKYDETKYGVPADGSITSTYKGFKFAFHTEAHRDLFAANPEQYIPQYGGFCSWGISEEVQVYPTFKVPWGIGCLGPTGSRLSWTIQNNRLYLFRSFRTETGGVDNVPKNRFLSDPERWAAVGDANWNAWMSEINKYSDGSSGGDESPWLRYSTFF